MSANKKPEKGKRSIFRALFIPLFLIMVLQTIIFYFSAVYGGLEQTLTQNSADIMTQRLLNRKNDLETTFNNNWNDLNGTVASLKTLYDSYEKEYGDKPLLTNKEHQIQFLSDTNTRLIDTLRQNKVNGIFLILNDQTSESGLEENLSTSKYGLCIRDMDQNSNYTDTSDLLLTRGPSSIIDQIGISLDSSWEAQYTFQDKNAGDFFYEPLSAAFQNPEADGDDLGFFSVAHQLDNLSQEVISYSIPLFSSNGYPYGVLGFEITTKYLNTVLPYIENDSMENGCYVFAQREKGSTECVPITASGSLYTRCFDSNTILSTAEAESNGGFSLTGRGDTSLFGVVTPIKIYNSKNPFDDQELVLIHLVERSSVFAYIDHIKHVMQLVSLLSLVIGLAFILLVSHHFASPITALAKKVRNMKPQAGFKLEHLGITEIDQLVDSIEDLNHNVSKDIARTEFFSRMSHDMRTPMNAIISFSSPELLENADEKIKDNYLDKIHTSGEYLLGLINEVLDMTKIESKKTELHPAPLLIQHCWDTVIPIIEKLAQKKDIEFVKDVPSNSDLCILADEQHLEQITVNLLSNAVKFTPNGGQVTLRTALADDSSIPENILFTMDIIDNGIGMSSEFMKKLYTPFEQENEGREGTGLGLSIAKTLVELMGGTITCESEKDVGTSFHIVLSLPKCQPPAAIADTSEALSAVSDDCLKGRCILVCEDHPLNTQIICRLLERKGMTVITAADGKEGLDTFQSSQAGTFDAVLMDIRMPVMDGLEATSAIRASDHADAAVIPIIAMTANAFAEDVQASHQAGMNAHLSKPIEPDKLYETLKKLMA